MKQTPSIDDVISFIKNKNGTLISKELSSKDHNFWYTIKCNIHPDCIWRAKWYTLIKRKSWCAECKYNSWRITKKQIEDLVQSKNGILLSNECFGSQSTIKVKCLKDNYEWETKWAILQQGSWCPKCAKLVKHTKEEIDSLVSARGGRLIKFTSNVRENLTIECRCGNIFTPNLSNFVKGSWCSACKPKQATQTKLFNIIKDIFPNYKVLYDTRPFSWLKMNKKKLSKMQIDIWIPELKIAIEYDGKQHYHKSKFFSSSKDPNGAAKELFKIKRRDNKKNKLIAQHPEDVKHFIRIKYTEPITKERIIEILKENKIESLNNELFI